MDKKRILDEAKKLDKNCLTCTYLREHPNLLGYTENQIITIFGSWSAFRKELGLSSAYRNEKEVIMSVKNLALRTGVFDISKSFYEEYKNLADPSTGTQYRFMKKKGLSSYSEFIKYCIQYEGSLKEEAIVTSKKDSEILKLVKDGFSDKCIAKTLQVSPNTIRRLRKENNLDNNYKKELESIRAGEQGILLKVDVISCINKGLTIKETSDKLGISKSLVQKRARLWGLSFKKENKFNEEQYKDLKNKKFSNKEIAKIMNICESYLRLKKRELGI